MRVRARRPWTLEMLAGALVVCLVALGPVVVVADTGALHVFPYCEPGTFCGHSDQAALDEYVCDAVQETNLEWAVTGLSFQPTTKAVNGTSPNPAPKHCADGDDAGTLCDHDS